TPANPPVFVRRFNGAAVFQPRKLPFRSIARRNSPALQWGRGLSTAEVNLKTVKEVAEELASMGPRSFNRGSETVSARRWSTVSLQWGRGLSTAEVSRRRASLNSCPCGFNGAAVFQPRKSRHPLRARPPRACFNG